MGMPARGREVTIRRPDEIARMRHAGGVLVDVLDTLHRELRAGITTADLDAIAERMIYDAGAIPSFKGYRGFPRSICASINDEVVHGIPSPRRRLFEGDVVGLDVGWTVVTADGSLAAHFENSVAVTNGAAEVLTER